MRDLARRILRMVAMLGVSVALILPAGQNARVRADDIVTTLIECGTTRGPLIGANPNRIGGVIQNVGTLHVNIGRGHTMTTLHVGSAYNMTPGYRGGFDCVTQPGTGKTAVEIIEEVR